jgi:hypothetical protein
VNDDIGHYFQTWYDLRQGDPLLPMLFNIVADLLAILIAMENENGQVGGLIPLWWRKWLPFCNLLMIRTYLWNMTYKSP